MEEPGRFRDSTLVWIRQPDRSGGAALPVALEKGRDLRLWCEFCRLAFPSRARDACGPRDSSEYTHRAAVSGGVRQLRIHPNHQQRLAVAEEAVVAGALTEEAQVLALDAHSTRGCGTIVAILDSMGTGKGISASCGWRIVISPATGHATLLHPFAGLRPRSPRSVPRSGRAAQEARRATFATSSRNSTFGTGAEFVDNRPIVGTELGQRLGQS